MSQNDIEKPFIRTNNPKRPVPVLVSNLAEIEISYRTKVRPSERKKISNSTDSADVAKEIFNTDTIEYREEFLILCLNRTNHVLGWVKVSSGGMSATIADPKVIFSVALKAAASSIILMHNHPSGIPYPSTPDIDLTKKLVAAGRLLDINVLDHLIITPEGRFFSFADEGLIG